LTLLSTFNKIEGRQETKKRRRMLQWLATWMLRLVCGYLGARDIRATRLVCSKLRYCQGVWEFFPSHLDLQDSWPLFVPEAVRMLEFDSSVANMNWLRCQLAILPGAPAA
jgi:hypothetical protein